MRGSPIPGELRARVARHGAQAVVAAVSLVLAAAVAAKGWAPAFRDRPAPRPVRAATATAAPAPTASGDPDRSRVAADAVPPGGAPVAPRHPTPVPDAVSAVPSPAPAASPRPAAPRSELSPSPAPTAAGAVGDVLPEVSPEVRTELAPADGQDAAPQGFVPEELVFPDGHAAPVVTVGLNPDRTLEVPPDPSVVGWWDGGARAGDVAGSVVLAGHVDSARYGLGVMVRLARIAPGDRLELRTATSRVVYEVESRVEVAQSALDPQTGAFDQAVAPRLVLITCGGPFDRRARHYRDNVVVFARPLS